MVQKLNRPTQRQTDTQTDTQTDRQTDRHTHTHTHTHMTDIIAYPQTWLLREKSMRLIHTMYRSQLKLCMLLYTSPTTVPEGNEKDSDHS